jgi:hypothetical protein
MPGRILNFSEFFGKYSSDTEKNLDDFTNAASNFEEGFDDETYNQNQIGPNRPVAGGTEVTPPQPGETGAPKFTSQPDAEMNAPEEEELEETPEEEATETPTEQAAEETEEAPEAPEEEEGDETPEPEMGANPEESKEDEEKVEESRLVKGFHQFISESYHDADYLSDDWNEEEEDEDWKEDRFDDGDDTEIYDKHGYCEDCGEPNDEFGSTCGCNM